MKGLRKYLAPFMPDISGAAAALYDMGAIIVISDAGGCTGNVCGFDEPRWFRGKSAIFSAGLRDMDAIFGRDDKFIDKLACAADKIKANFVAVIGTPVSTVIATDYRAIAKQAEARTGLPVIAVETTGTELYDIGIVKAQAALFERFTKGEAAAEPFIGVLGALPQDTAAFSSPYEITEQLTERYGLPARLYGPAEIENAKAAKLNIAVSPAGAATASLLAKIFGTPWKSCYPLRAFDAKAFATAHRGKRLLIIHQQVLACSIRNELRKTTLFPQISCASCFMEEPYITEQGDVALINEEELARLTEKENYNLIMADPLFKKAMPKLSCEFLPLPHFAVSGSLYAKEKEADFWGGLL